MSERDLFGTALPVLQVQGEIQVTRMQVGLDCARMFLGMADRAREMLTGELAGVGDTVARTFVGCAFVVLEDGLEAGAEAIVRMLTSPDLTGEAREALALEALVDMLQRTLRSVRAMEAKASELGA